MNLKTENVLKAAMPTISIIEARQLAVDIFGPISSSHNITASVRRLRDWSRRFTPVTPPLPLSHYTTTELKRELKARHEARCKRMTERNDERRQAVANYCKDRFGVDIGTLYPVSPK